MNISIKIFSSLILLAILNSCDSGSSYSSIYEEKRPLTEEELKQELLNTECANAEQYLDGSLEYTPIYKNVLSMKVKGLKLKCKIKNKATLATLKDIRANIEFKSKTGAKILDENFDIYEFIEPNGTFIYKTDISITNQQYKDISSFSWTILGARCK